MDYRDAQGVTNKIHSFFTFMSLASVAVSLLALLNRAWILFAVFAFATFLFGKAASYMGRQTRRYFDLANIQGLIKAPGMKTSAKRRMAQRIYDTNAK